MFIFLNLFFVQKPAEILLDAAKTQGDISIRIEIDIGTVIVTS